MEYSINKGEIAVNETVLNTSLEQPIDIDFTLPDYCPDIQKILKCQIDPVINLRAINGDKVDIEGNVKARLMYLDEERKHLRCFEYTSPFSLSIDMKHQGNEIINPIIFARTHIEYVNCRAISPRRLSISGAFTVKVKVLAKIYKEIACDIADEFIEQKHKKIIMSSVAGEMQQPFLVSEILEIAKGKPQIDNVLHTQIIPTIEEVKPIANKFILKGEAIIKVMYQGASEQSSIETMEYSIPISQILDIEGVDDDCMCESMLDTISYTMEPRTDSAGEDTLLECEIRFLATIIAYKDTETQVVTDAYSTKYEIELDHKNVLMERMLECHREVYNYKETVESENVNITEVFDIWNEVVNATASIKDDRLCFKGKFNVCILAQDENSEPTYIEKMMDFEHFIEKQDLLEDYRLDPDVTVTSIGYRITGSGGLELRIQMNLEIKVYNTNSVKSICYASADETKLKAKDESASIIIYYAEKGENIWNIAMRYCTSVRAIKEENDIEEEVLSDKKMLLIPV